MRNQSFIALALVLFILLGCERASPQSKVYATFSGKIENNTAKNLVLKGLSRHYPQNWKKIIKINTDGTFKDTLKLVNVEDLKKEVTDIVYVLGSDDKPFGNILLENGQDLQISFDARDWRNRTFIGSYAPNNNYLKDKEEFLEKVFGKTLSTPNPHFVKKGNKEEQLENTRKKLEKLLGKYNISKYLYESEKQMNRDMLRYIAKVDGSSRKGQASVGFVYKNYKGGKTSLEDLKGKYLYIDIWATWCLPCIGEIPFLKKIEKKYRYKNIAFVSISIDSDEQAWRKMVTDKRLSGIQLFAQVNNNNTSIDKFLESFRVLGIPRFILLDTQGKIVDEYAPRPSEPRVQKLLDSLLN